MGHVTQYTKQITNLKGADYCIQLPIKIRSKFWYILRVVIAWSRFEGAWLFFFCGVKEQRINAYAKSHLTIKRNCYDRTS